MERKTLTLRLGSLIRILGPALSFISASEAAEERTAASEKEVQRLDLRVVQQRGNVLRKVLESTRQYLDIAHDKLNSASIEEDELL